VVGEHRGHERGGDSVVDSEHEKVHEDEVEDGMDLEVEEAQCSEFMHFPLSVGDRRKCAHYAFQKRSMYLCIIWVGLSLVLKCSLFNRSRIQTPKCEPSLRAPQIHVSLSSL
jgi:hypothetical protein